jgi:hypothetical protein
MSGIHILLSDHHGVYVPQVFANGFSMRRWHVSGKDARLLRKGPSDEWYWETWDDVTANAWMKDGKHIWRLYQDGDLFAYCEELMNDEEYEGFFGEPRKRVAGEDGHSEQDMWYDTSHELK